MTASTVAVVSPVSSSHEASTIFSTVNETKRRSSPITMDDNMIDYTSMMGLEDKRRRFSEDVADMDLKDSERLKKLYRQMQRQVHCGQGSKEALTVFLLSLRNGSSIFINNKSNTFDFEDRLPSCSTLSTQPGRQQRQQIKPLRGEMH
jgi:hypothetical protein